MAEVLSVTQVDGEEVASWIIVDRGIVVVNQLLMNPEIVWGVSSAGIIIYTYNHIISNIPYVSWPVYT